MLPNSWSSSISQFVRLSRWKFAAWWTRVAETRCVERGFERFERFIVADAERNLVTAAEIAD